MFWRFSRSQPGEVIGSTASVAPPTRRTCSRRPTTAAEFQKVVAQYPGTPAGASASLFLAEEQRKEKKFTEANATLQSFVEKYPNHGLKGTARMAMAANLESLGKRDEALAAYQRLAADDPQGFSAPVAMISQVHIFKEKNQLAEARQVCETILTKYRDSLVANEATRQLRLLKPPAPPEPPAAQTPAPVTNVPNFLLRPPDAPAAASAGSGDIAEKAVIGVRRPSAVE